MQSSQDYRHWFLTWRTYGTWLPGDYRGTTSETRKKDGQTLFHNRPGTPMADPNPALERHAGSLRKSSIVFLSDAMARIVADQLAETAKCRGWVIHAIAIMTDHVHIVVRVPGDPNPSDLLRYFKSYASRRLNKAYPNRKSRWWCDSGSTRILREESNVLGAIEYVRSQPNALLICIGTDWG